MTGPTMPNFANVNPAWDAVCDYLALDPDALALSRAHRAAVADMLKGGSVSFVASAFAEYAYAHRDELPASFLSLAAGCADVCLKEPGGVGTIGGDRGFGILGALRRDSGEAGKWPSPDDDPPVHPQLAPDGPVPIPPGVVPGIPT